MKRFVCLKLIPVNLLNTAAEFRNVTIPVDRICEVTDHLDTTLYKGTIQSKILMNDGFVYYAAMSSLEICDWLN